jgi:predicted ester cyclase
MHAGSPDMEVITEHSMEDGEWLAHRYTTRGTHTGELFGRPPTGKPFEAGGMDAVRVRDGQLVEHWAFVDSLGGR